VLDYFSKEDNMCCAIPSYLMPSQANGSAFIKDKSVFVKVDIAGFCHCFVFIPSDKSTAVICRNCGKPRFYTYIGSTVKCG
jgi:hypothetical protein